MDDYSEVTRSHSQTPQSIEFLQEPRIDSNPPKMIKSSYFYLKSQLVGHLVGAFQYILQRIQDTLSNSQLIYIIFFNGLNLSICSEIVQDTYVYTHLHIHQQLLKKLRAQGCLWMERFLTAPIVIPAAKKEEKLTRASFTSGKSDTKLFHLNSRSPFFLQSSFPNNSGLIIIKKAINRNIAST